MLAFLGIFSLFGALIGGLIGFLFILFWLWMLIDAIKNRGLGDGERVVWVLVIIFLPVLGPILYFLLGKGK